MIKTEKLGTACYPLVTPIVNHRLVKVRYKSTSDKYEGPHDPWTMTKKDALASDDVEIYVTTSKALGA